MALSLTLPMIVGLIYGESAWLTYAATSTAALVLGLLLYLVASGTTPSSGISRREGFAGVVGAWSVMVLVGAVPYWADGSFPSFVDALFESASGFSTTGATVIGDIEGLPHAHLFQRSLSHWIGGMGIIVLSIAVLPELAVGGMQLFAAESSGISTDKLAPRIVSTAQKLWVCYAGMTAVLIGLLLAGGMNFFDAITHSFGTIATGGFSPKNASVGAFNSVYIEAVLTTFMIASGISFALLYRLFVRRDPTPLLLSTEVRGYLGIFSLFTLAITFSLLSNQSYSSFSEAFRVASFQTASVISTTGFGTADFNTWPDLCRYLLVLLMFLGGCAGSTAGGVKVIRVLVVFKHSTVELKKLLYPNLVHPVTLGRRAVPDATIRGILGFFMLYIVTTGVATALVLATGVDLVTGVTAVISAMNSIGPGLDMVGPAANYGHLPASCKVILSACMIIGRLEIYTLFVLFTTSFWRFHPRSG